ncbi:TetR/AcrR family transcriptional regulator [Williamsia phyllosphaerae]|uniref:Transcriptional regulator, TetR family protein n=1 Tax=Williamsia phyllosphaerae TaxID=885042 RepID=A0ABQ1V058_9NOCA|nr:TetR/AcrR family transcriptional regulator [Williamsia phyllosphaerae]GGF32720.1 putative transcriptional regulator, TetR family protein [Williamsia phyllosphaerae]
MSRSTRESIVTATAELMRRQGYAAVSIKQIVAGSGAPIGSIYHHFPGGKSQIARAALVDSGAAYAQLVPTLMEGYDDLGDAIAHAFDAAATTMESIGFANMCPVSTVAGEVADSDESLRVAAAEIFESWVSGAAEFCARRGVEADVAREVAISVICALEGAFVMARTLRSTEPLLAAGATVAHRYRGVRLTEGPAVAAAMVKSR